MLYRVIAAVATLALFVPAAAGEETALTPREGVLVLRNGHVVQGRITRLGDRYVVTFGPTSEVRFPAGDVEFQCPTLEEAYFRKREILDPTSTRQRLELAEWCLRHELPHRAADQLLAALAINPFDPRARSLRRRLLHLAETRRITQQPREEPTAPLDWQAIARALETTPPEAVETFTSAVQPLLLNRCGTNACHGSPANSGFHLMRPLEANVLPRRLTQRNLYAALQMIDFQDPDHSPLLTVPRGPHGGENEGLFAGRAQRQWEQLRDWVRLTAAPEKETARGADLPPAVETAERSTPPTWTAASAPRPATAEAPADAIHRSIRSGQTPTANPPADFAPRDPFDPEIFNRRHLPEKSTPSTSNASDKATSKN